MLHRAFELGVTLVDTADSYCRDEADKHHNEELVATALARYDGDAEAIVVATKGGLVRTGPGQWAAVGRPAYLRQCVEMSLRRLRMDTIPLYQLHRIDEDVPAADQFGELQQMQEEGKIRHLGLSEVTVDDIEQAREEIDVVSVQNRYSIGHREHEDVVDYCEREGIAFIPWYPLEAGKLAEPSGPVDEAARRTGATHAQVALAWLLRRSEVMLPIPGTSSREHLEENTAAASIELDDDAPCQCDECRRRTDFDELCLFRQGDISPFARHLGSIDPERVREFWDMPYYLYRHACIRATHHALGMASVGQERKRKQKDWGQTPERQEIRELAHARIRRKYGQ